MLWTYTIKNILKNWAWKLKSHAWPAIFRNTKECPKNTKENQQQICFAHYLLTTKVINLNPWQLIYIFPYLYIDTQLGHIRCHMWSGHNGHYGHYDHKRRSAIWLYGHKCGQVGCLLKGMEKCRSPVKELNW